MSLRIKIILAKVNVAQSIFAFTPEAIRSGLVQAFMGNDFVLDKWGNKVYLWAFEGVQRIPDPEHPEDMTRGAVFGTILRVVERGEIRTWDPVKGHSRTHEVTNLIKESLVFYYDAWSEVLAIEERPHISYKRVLENLAKLLCRNGKLGKIEIEPYPRTEDLIKRIKSLKRITKAKIWLRIPNPDATPLFERMYREHVQMRATNASLVFSGSDLQFDDTLIEESVYAAHRGYGRYVIYGAEKGEIVDSASLITRKDVWAEDENDLKRRLKELVDEKRRELNDTERRK